MTAKADEEEGLRAVLRFTHRCLADFDAVLNRTATWEGWGPGPGRRPGPSDAARAWLARRFDTRGFAEMDWKVAAFLVGLWFDATAVSRLQAIYPGVGLGKVPMELVRHALDPTGDDLLEVWAALDPRGAVCRAGIAVVREPFVLVPGKTCGSDLGRGNTTPSSMDPNTMPPWVLPLESRTRLDEIAYSEGTKVGLREVALWWQHRDTVLKTWGGCLPSSSSGVVALFVGPPGSGKREAAARVSSELGLSAWEVVAPRLLSRYVGEAEERLHGVFHLASERGIGLFFGDAQDLLSHRTAVRTAHDRYSNLLVDAFVQEVDRFSGLLIMATTNEAGLDSAVMRRVNVTVRFTWPDAGRRTALWQCCAQSFPGFRLTPGEAQSLGEAFAFSACEIESAFLSAATLAAHRHERFEVRHLWEACRSRAVGRGDLIRTGEG